MNNIRIYLSMSADGVGGEDEDDSLSAYLLFIFVQRGKGGNKKNSHMCCMDVGSCI